MKYKKLLSFQGGGVRAVVACQWLHRLNINPKSLYLLSGASSGAIVAGAIAGLCLSPLEVDELFGELSKQIFRRKWYGRWFDFLIRGYSYDIKTLQSVLDHHFGNIKVGDCKLPLAVVLWDLDNTIHGERASKPVVVHNLKSFRDYHQLDFRLADVLCASCAAPTYFAAKNFEDREKIRTFSDGGLCDNLAVTSAYDLCRDPMVDNRSRAKEIVALTLGNGGHFEYQDSKANRGWKTPNTLRSLVACLTQANETITLRNMNSYLGSRFFFQNTPAPKKVDLDDTRAIPTLRSWAKDTDLSHVQAWMRGYFI